VQLSEKDERKMIKKRNSPCGHARHAAKTALSNRRKGNAKPPRRQSGTGGFTISLRRKVTKSLAVLNNVANFVAEKRRRKRRVKVSN